MPTCLAVLVSAGDFLSSWMAKTPEERGPRAQDESGFHRTDHLRPQDGRVTELTFALVDQEAAGPSEVDGVVDLQALQVLAHLPTLGELGMSVSEVDLTAKGTRLDQKDTHICRRWLRETALPTFTTRST